MCILGGMAGMICMAFLSLFIQELNLVGVQSSIKHFRQLGAEVIYNPHVFRISVKLLFYRIAVFLCTGHYTITAIFDDPGNDGDDNTSHGDDSSNNKSKDDEEESQSLQPHNHRPSPLSLLERMDEFSLLARGGGPEVDYADDDEIKERMRKQQYEEAKNKKKCCDKNHHPHDGGDNNDEEDDGYSSSHNGYDWSAGRSNNNNMTVANGNNNSSAVTAPIPIGPKHTNSMQMNCHDRV